MSPVQEGEARRTDGRLSPCPSRIACTTAARRELVRFAVVYAAGSVTFGLHFDFGGERVQTGEARCSDERGHRALLQLLHNAAYGHLAHSLPSSGQC